MAKYEVSKEVITLHGSLGKEWKKSSPNLDLCGDLLNKLKLQFTKFTFLPISETEVTRKDEFIIARDVLEIGALWSIKKRDIPSFERYMQQLKCYYLDFNKGHDESPYMYQLLGLNLLCLLSQNRVAEFHTELELLTPDQMQNIYIKHPVQMEQYLMEGSYNKIFVGKANVPADNYNYFIDILIGTVRTEIAACIEKAYEKMSLAEATRMINLKNPEEMSAYGQKRGWKLANDKFYYFKKEVRKTDDIIPSLELSEQAINYARELEMIV